MIENTWNLTTTLYGFKFIAGFLQVCWLENKENEKDVKIVAAVLIFFPLEPLVDS